uniref:Uncharacterized protein n=1 Tax=Nicotiana tabacum TaxID=4097 RepID=A0A1S4B597_TOBAC
RSKGANKINLVASPPPSLSYLHPPVKSGSEQNLKGSGGNPSREHRRLIPSSTFSQSTNTEGTQRTETTLFLGGKLGSLSLLLGGRLIAELESSSSEYCCFPFVLQVGA